MISDEAVEAAAKAAYVLRPATYYLDDSVVTWEQLSDSGSGQRRKDRQLAEARAAIEAAALQILEDFLPEQGPYRFEAVDNRDQ